MVAYEWAQDAQKEAASYPVSEAHAELLRRQCTRKAADLGNDGVRGHKVSFPIAAWSGAQGLPDGVPHTGCISRGDVLDIGQQVRARARPASDLLVATFIWGWGATGYGPHRLASIQAAAGNRLEPSLQRALDAVNENPAAPDAIAGYTHLYGGQGDQDRVAPGQQPWSRLHGFGPAFFTKFLYFSTPGALILDNRLANAVYQRSHLPHLISKNTHSIAWTPYRYSVYLHWMTQTAQTVGTETQLLELTMFQPPRNPDRKDGTPN